MDLPIKKPRLRKKKKERFRQIFWRIRYYETVIWELKRLHLEREIEVVEKEAAEAMVAEKEATEEKLAQEKVTEITNAPVVVALNANTSGGDKVLDSGAMEMSGSSHRSQGGKQSRELLDEPVNVKGVNGQCREITHKFNMKVPSAVPGQDVILKDTLDIPGTPHDLVSVGKLDDLGMKTIFENGEGKVTNEEGQMVMYAKKINGLYRLREISIEQCPQHVINYSTNSLKVAHDALGHRAFNVIRKMLNLPPESAEHMNPVCKACLYAQAKTDKRKLEALTNAPRFGYRLHADVSAKWPNACAFNKENLQRWTLIGDEYSDFLYVSWGMRKSDAKHAVYKQVDVLNNQIAPEGVAEFQSDSGSEFKNMFLREKMKDRNVVMRQSTPEVKYENGWIEARMKQIKKSARAMMYRAKAPVAYWPYAVNQAVQLRNVVPNVITGKSPYEKSTGIVPDFKYKNFTAQLFCECLAKVWRKGMLEGESRQCIYMGICPETGADLVRPVGGKKGSQRIRPAKVVAYNSDVFPTTGRLVPQPEARKPLNFDSDSDQEEDGIRVYDGEEMKEPMYEDEESSDADSEPEDDEEQDLESPMLGLRDRDKAPRSSLRRQLQDDGKMARELEDDEDKPQGTIDGQEAWEIEDIVGEEYRKGKKGKRIKFYQVKWKGDYPLDWLHCSRLRAPDLREKWEAKKKAKQKEEEKEGENLVMSICQLNNEVEVKPVKLEEENPFKKLFDPKFDKRIAPPKGYQTMLKHVFAEHFSEALIREKNENQKWHTYVEVPRSEVPKGTKILKPVTAYDIKYNARGEIEKFKSRVCLNGKDTIVDPTETYEAIAGTGTIRLLLCMAARYGLGVAQTDVKNFFLQAVMPKEKVYYAEIPDGWAENDPKTHVAKVLAPWYGLKESAKIAGDQLAAVMKHAGMIENVWFPKVFFKWKGDDFVACANHIDDGVWIYTDKKLLDETLAKIDEKFKMTKEFNVTKLLGFEVNYDKEKGLMKLHQGSYHIAKLHELGFKNGKPARSPGYIPPKIENPIFPHELPQAPPDKVRLFQKKVGIQMWGLQTDPSSMFTVHKLASRMLNPQKEDWAQMERLERYKATNPEMGIVLRRAASGEKLKKGTNLDCLTYYADADLAGDKRDAKSTTGYCVHLGESGMFDWKSKKQTCVCQSSCESEIYSSKECTCHAIWLRKGLTFMGFTFTKPTPVCQDNQSAIALCDSDKHHSRTRHFRMHVNLLKDNVIKRVTRYPWIPTKYMKGDLFNKLHDPKRHEELCEQNGIYAQKISLIPAKAEMLKVDGWIETVKQERERQQRIAKGIG